MERKLYSINEVKELIAKGKKMVLSGSESALDQLPKGEWIGGTIPYFMDKEKGMESFEKIFVDDQTEVGIDFKIKYYTKGDIQTIGENDFENGFSVVIMPAGSAMLSYYALNALEFPKFFDNPIIGFIAGVHLNEIGKKNPKIYNGLTGEKKEDGLISLHVKLAENKIARVEIINIFEPNERTYMISFPENGFQQSKCIIDGKERDFIDYLTEINHDIKYPLIVNQNGAMVNKSFQLIDKENAIVHFYSPIFKDERYFPAKTIADYKAAFNKQVKEVHQTNYACNCILNYLYGELENNKVNITGATTFGEIGFQLLNQTFVYLEIDQY